MNWIVYRLTVEFALPRLVAIRHNLMCPSMRTIVSNLMLPPSFGNLVTCTCCILSSVCVVNVLMCCLSFSYMSEVAVTGPPVKKGRSSSMARYSIFS